MGFWLHQDVDFTVGGFAAHVFAAIHYTGGAAFNFSSTKQLSLVCLNDGYVMVRRGQWNGTTIGSPSTVQLGFDDYYVEWRVKIDNANGECEVRLNDEVILEVEGDTQALGTPLIDGVEWVPRRLDDLYVLDPTGPRNNTFLGSRFHVIANPMSAVSAAGFTPGTIANLEATDSDYNEAATAGLEDLYADGARLDRFEDPRGSGRNGRTPGHSRADARGPGRHWRRRHIRDGAYARRGLRLLLSNARVATRRLR